MKSSSRPSKAYQPPVTPASPEVGIFGCLVLLLIFATLGVIVEFGFERTIVAVEGFFIFTGWAALRVAGLLPKPKSDKLENIRVYTAVGFGVSCGILAAYLVLTTQEGQVLTDWVTAQSIRLVGSLLISVFIFGVLDFAWRAFLDN